MSRFLIVGGNGSLGKHILNLLIIGRAFVSRFAPTSTVLNFDLSENPNAQFNYVIKDNAETLDSVEGISHLIESNNMMFDGIMITAGGWNGNNTFLKNFNFVRWKD
jgi:hypothetical protein